jgi:glutaredoxin
MVQKKTTKTKKVVSSKRQNKETHKKHIPHKKQKELKNKNILYSIIAGVILILIIFTFNNVIKNNNKNESIVAIFDNSEITLEELNKEYSALPEEYKSMISKEQYLEELLIPQKIILKQANIVSDERLENEYKNFLEMSGYTEEEIKQSLKDNQVTEEKFMDSLRIQIFLNDTLYNKIKVTEEEILSFYELNKDGLKNENDEIILFEEIKEDIKEFLISQKLQEETEKYISEIRSQMNIKILSENIKSDTTQEDTITETTLDLKGFNECLANNGVTIYGSTTCPYCQQLVTLLGGHDSVESVYVECTTNQERCRNEMIGSGVPEIQINGEMYQGPRTIESLSTATGC